MACVNFGNWLVDVRDAKKSNDISLDVSQHIPQRISVGPILVLADNPRVFLSVVRKRLARLAALVELKRCQTMDKAKRAGLGQELLTLRSSRFSAKASVGRQADTIFTSPEELSSCVLSAATIYITTPVLEKQMRLALEKLEPGGLLVTYGQWPAHYRDVLEERVV